MLSETNVPAPLILNFNMKKQFIVAGIGTEIGKTFISSVLVEALQADYWKPIQSGGLDFSDTDTVKSLVSVSNNTFFPEAYRLNEPLSPHAAAALDGITIELSKIQLPVTERNLIVELAGGLMVPLNDNDKILNLPGSINHTFFRSKLSKVEIFQLKELFSMVFQMLLPRFYFELYKT
jgi:dethiobiotin synthetase